MSTAAYLIDRGPSVALDSGLYEEVRIEKEVNLLYLNIFGCITYVHVDAENRDKLDSKSRKCTFIGYGFDEFGYRFRDRKKKKKPEKSSEVQILYSMRKSYIKIRTRCRRIIMNI